MIVLELVKDGKLFGFVPYKEVADRMMGGNTEVRFYGCPKINFDNNELLKPEFLTITLDDLLSKKYREIDISLERLDTLKHIVCQLKIPFEQDYNLIDKLLDEIDEISRIRFEILSRLGL